jgi:hypothetical protein
MGIYTLLFALFIIFYKVYILAFPFIFYSIFLIYRLRRRRNVLPKIIIKRSTILYLFIDYLTNLIHSRLIINKKGPNEVLKVFFQEFWNCYPKYIYIYLFYYSFFILPILGLTNPTPLKIISSSRFVKKRDTKELVCDFSFQF